MFRLYLTLLMSGLSNASGDVKKTPCEQVYCAPDPCLAVRSSCPAYPGARCGNNRCRCVLEWTLNGQVVDCTGRCPPVLEICTFCIHGTALDQNNCLICRCQDDPCIDPGCPEGHVCTGRIVNCPGRHCDPLYRPRCEIECPPVCDIPCPYGNVLDENNCPICECQPDPCLEPGCPDDFVCTDRIANCPSQNCDPAYRPQCEFDCPPVCEISCPFGNVLDENNCPICECQPDPCVIPGCPEGSVCANVTPNSCPAQLCDPAYLPECKDKCKLPADPGPCDAAKKRWFYNNDTKKCEKFFYGGCEGNANNFRSRQKCNRACK